MPDLLIYGAPDSSPDLFHAIPAGIIDPFLYAEIGGRRAATVSVLDADKVRALGIDVIDPAALGADELLASGPEPARGRRSRSRCAPAASWAWSGRSCRPSSRSGSPTTCARAASCSTSTRTRSCCAGARRRTPSSPGIRRAQKAADAAMAVAADLIHELRPGLTSEEIRAAMTVACDERGCDLPGDVIVAHGAPVGRTGTSPASARWRRARRSSSTSGRAIAHRAAGPT